MKTKKKQKLRTSGNSYNATNGMLSFVNRLDETSTVG